MSSLAASIIVLNYNGQEHLGPCLESVARDGWPSADVEVLLVDNGSSDRSKQIVTGEFPRVRFVEAGSNLGFAAGIRFGALRSTGRTLVFLNNDTRVQKGWLRALLDALENAPPEVASVAGRITSWDEKRIDFRDAVITFDGHAFQRDFGRPVESVVDEPPGEERVIPCGGNMAIRRDDFLSSGGFDDDFFAYLEDVDLGLRLRSQGRSIVYEPRARIFHRSGATGTALGIYNRGFLIEKNAFSVFYKNFDDGALRAWFPAVLLTLIHRTERIARERARGGDLLTIDPYRNHSSGVDLMSAVRAGETILQKVQRLGVRRSLVRGLEKAFGLAAVAAVAVEADFVADPHTLSQLRALHRIAVDLPVLDQKRKAGERLRKVTSREIFSRWPLAIVPTYPGDEDLFESVPFGELVPGDFPHLKARLGDIMQV